MQMRIENSSVSRTMTVIWLTVIDMYWLKLSKVCTITILYTFKRKVCTLFLFILISSIIFGLLDLAYIYIYTIDILSYRSLEDLYDLYSSRAVDCYSINRKIGYSFEQLYNNLFTEKHTQKFAKFETDLLI